MATVSPAYLVAAVRTWDTAVRTGSRSAKKRLYRQAVNQCKLLVNTSFPFFHRLCSPTLPLPCCHASSAPHVPFWRHAGLPTLPPCPPSPGSENTCLGNNQACPCCDPRLPPAMLLPFIDSGGGVAGAGWGVSHPGCRSVTVYCPATMQHCGYVWYGVLFMFMCCM